MSSYADSAQARALDERMSSSSDSGRCDIWFDEGPDVFTERCRASEVKRQASLPYRLRAAIAQMEMICPPKSGASE